MTHYTGLGELALGADRNGDQLNTIVQLPCTKPVLNNRSIMTPVTRGASQQKIHFLELRYLLVVPKFINQIR